MTFFDFICIWLIFLNFRLRPRTPTQTLISIDNVVDSSPVHGDTMVVLQEYFDWQVAKNPRQEPQLWKAFEKLGKEMYSPVHIEGDTMVVLQEYFDRQVAKNSRQEAQLSKAFEKLGKEMYSLSYIRNFNKDQLGGNGNSTRVRETFKP